MIPEQIIRERSYDIWVREGRPEGKTAEHWSRAQMELEIEHRVAVFPWAGNDCRGIVAPWLPISERPQRFISRSIWHYQSRPSNGAT
jgi:hypothetical protein